MHMHVLVSLCALASTSLVGCRVCGIDGSNEPPKPELPGPSPSCRLESDADTRTRTFALERFVLPASNDVGFNLDGLITTTNQHVDGCRKIDGFGGGSGGVDNAAAEIANDFDMFFEHTADETEEPHVHVVDSRNVHLALTIDHWNGTENDDCVGARISGTSGDVEIPELAGSAALADHAIALVGFGGPLEVTLDMHWKAQGVISLCESCPAVPARIVLDDVRMRLAFNASMDTLVLDTAGVRAPSSLLGGRIRYASDGGYAFSNEVANIARSLNPNLAGYVDVVFRSYVDLDGSPGPAISFCTSTGGGAVSADSFSVAVLVSGTQVP